MTDLTGKLIANTYKDILTINSSATNDGIDGTLRRVQDGEGTNSAISLSQNAAVVNGTMGVTGSMSVGGGLAVGSLTVDGLNVSALNAVEISATNITTDVLTAGTLTFQDVSVSTLRAGTVSATNINATNITVAGDNVATSSALASVNDALVSVEAVISSNIVFVLNAQASVLTVLAGLEATDVNLQNNINTVSTTVSAVNVQVGINATQIGLAQTSIAANASAITVNSDAITSINAQIAGGAFASVGTSATLETRIAGVSSTMATSIANVSSTLEARIAGVSTALASTSAALTSNINTVSATLSIANVSIAANSSAIAALQALTYASVGTSATLETRINSVSVLAETKASAATSANLETRIAAVSSTMATSISNSNSAITALSATLATSIGNSNSAITALSATMATSIANHLPLAGGTLTGALTLNADPTTDLNAATKQYVDNLTASGIHFHESVRVENPGALTVTYNNGTAGVGATLTNAGTQAALVIDGITMVVDDRVLIYEQADATQNGVYVVTNIGSGSTNWVLTRSSDADTSGNQDDSSLDEGSYFFVEEGNTGAGESYVCSTVGTITFGTTEINFVQFSSAITYTAGAGININASRVISTSGVPTNAELAAVSATMATSIANSNSAITALSATMATSIANVSATLESRIAGVSAIVPTSLTELGITDGSNGQVLQTDGNSVFTFVSVAAGGSGTVTNIKAGSNISMTEAGTTVTETTTSATIAVTSSPSFSSAVITGDLTVDTDTLFVDASEDKVGVGTLVPSATFEVESTDALLARFSGGSTTAATKYIQVVNTSDDTAGLNLIHHSDDEASVLNEANAALKFGTNDTERMRIDSSGNVGINQSALGGGAKLEVNGDIGIARTAGGYTFRETLGGAERAGINSNPQNELSFNTGAASEGMRLQTSGNLHVDGNVIAYSTTISDKRLKKDIAPIDNALWKVSQLNGCTFTYLKDDRKSAGLIAQDLEKVLPSAVIEDKAVFHGEEGETYKTVQYDQVIGLLVEAVKELTAKVEELENASTK